MKDRFISMEKFRNSNHKTLEALRTGVLRFKRLCHTHEDDLDLCPKTFCCHEILDLSTSIAWGLAENINRFIRRTINRTNLIWASEILEEIDDIFTMLETSKRIISRTQESHKRLKYEITRTLRQMRTLRSSLTN